ncbi:transcriptional regulator [Massilia sp. IC2-477]|uniref:winged helix-turn-helix domain-containing protein n=1 Tax=Massilia sp. IC2-477 TaxID=2887198 RepID=UPI001D12DAF3|nr:transcriptional regulator [Massilia sp. IC2-477]MCC2957566.1 transcriptional regulator [Massilia sp. IC2-477]
MIMASGMQLQGSYAFLDFELVPARRRLLKGELAVAIGDRAFDLLVLFASRPGEVLSSETLMRAVWPNSVVEEVNLRVQVAGLRRLLGGEARPCIATVPGRGYCFTAPVRRLEPMLLPEAVCRWRHEALA